MKVAKSGIWDHILFILAVAEQCLNRLWVFSLSRVGCTRGWEGADLGHQFPAGQMDTPHHMMLCSAIKLWGKIKRRREWSEWWCLTFPRNHDKLCLPGSGWTPACWCEEAMKWFCFVCVNGFALPLKLPLSQLTSFLIFTLPVLPCFPQGGTLWMVVWGWAACSD